MTTDMLRRSIALAAEAGRLGNRPFGAVLVDADGALLAEGRNEADTTGDVTAHAELVAIRAAAAAGFGRLAGSVMYASGEPCPMCAAACVWAGVARIVFGASARGFSEVLTAGPHFDLSCTQVVGAAGVALEVCGPLLEAEVVAAMGVTQPGYRR